MLAMVRGGCRQWCEEGKMMAIRLTEARFLEVRLFGPGNSGPEMSWRQDQKEMIGWYHYLPLQISRPVPANHTGTFTGGMQLAAKFIGVLAQLLCQ